MSTNIRRIELFEVLRSHGSLQPRKLECRQLLKNHIIHIVRGEQLSDSDNKLLEKVIENFTKCLWEKWKKSRSYLETFKENNACWLNEVIVTSSNNLSKPSTSGESKLGRPKVLFANGSVQTKRRRVQAEVQEKTEEEICFAAEMKLRAGGKRDAATILSKMKASPRIATRLKKLNSIKQDLKKLSFSADEAVAFFVSFKFTRHQYVGLRSLVNKKGLKNLFPTYDKIIEAKKKCYPCNVSATNLSAEVPLQNLLDHTTNRILDSQEEVILPTFKNFHEPEIPLKIIYKWGSDGSGSQRNYKQKCEGDDSNILTTSVVPLQLSFESKSKQSVVLWQNPRTSSTRFCRPVKIQFIKETDDVIRSEFSQMESQISQLSPTVVTKNGKKYIISHKMVNTMVDGKVCNSLMSTSSQKCYICKAGPTQFNNLEYVKTLPTDPVSLNLGLSTLHAYIRFFECLLHISYRIDLKIWRIPQNLKGAFNDRKQKIIKMFREETGLLIDIPKVGFGNTNDGNTARKFFADPILSSKLTGIDQNLIYRCNVILRTLNCNYQINSSRFGQYAYETAQMYVNLYEWYPMPPTVHKILMHSKEVIDHFLLPIGQLGEDAQEARHKEIRYYREHNTRKISRKFTNEDLFNVLLVSSDPLISSLRVLPPRQEGIFNCDIIDLLETPDV